MTSSKKNREELLAVGTELKGKILSKFFFLGEQLPLSRQEIYSKKLLTNMMSKIHQVGFSFSIDREYTAEEEAAVMIEAIERKISELKLENQKLREKFNFRGSI